MRKKRLKIKYFSLLLAVILSTAWLCACKPVEKIVEVAETITIDLPSAKDTLTSLLDINSAMSEAMSGGERELTFNVADISENELRSIGDNLSTFWGKPTHYTITNEYKDVEGIISGRTVNVQTITNTFELSNNFYVYDFIRNGNPIPDEMGRAMEIAAVLPGIASEIFPGPAASDYENTLAAHDWLVANLEYDVGTPSISDENSSYGALVLQRTMCQGYAEALELLLKCYTDVEIVQIVGEALNTGLFIDAEQQEGDGEGDGEGEGNTGAESEDWRGHAWNAVKMFGEWYQIDTTFNDPLGNPSGRVTHFYFGQSDGVMLKNHRWAYDFFPSSYAGDFLFYRQSGLFANDWDEFEAIIVNLLTVDQPPAFFETAVVNETITEDNIQFIYRTLDNLDAIMWSEQVWNNIHVHSFELVFNP